MKNYLIIYTVLAIVISLSITGYLLLNVYRIGIDECQILPTVLVFSMIMSAYYQLRRYNRR